MRAIQFVCLLLSIALLPQLATATERQSLAVLLSKSPTLTPQEKISLQNVIANGFEETGKYRIVDPEVINNMLEDEVMEALLLGNEDKLDAIQKKYRVDVLTNISAKVEHTVAIGGYSMASASVTIACRRNDDATLFDQQASEPQNGYHGMPEWLGSTSEAARKVALHAAVASVFTETGMETVDFPFPERLKLRLEETSAPSPPLNYLPKYQMTGDEVRKLTQLAAPTIGKRDNLTCSVMDSGKRMAAVGITGIDIDVQRGRRMDTARFEVFDMRKKRSIRKMDLPRRVDGIRRPRSRDIVDIAFAPTGRFLAIVSAHPALWLYDNLSGDLLIQTKISALPKNISIAESGDTLKILSKDGILFYKINKE